MKNYLLFLIPLWAMVSCTRDSGSGVEIYLLKAYQAVSNGQEIIAGSEKLPKNPLILYNDIISYDSTEHYFKIDSIKASQLQKTNWPVSGTGFAITINREIVYSGYLVPGYSSTGCGWYCIDPLAFNCRLKITLGYPAGTDQLQGEDQRNNSKLIDFLKEDGKLNH